MSRNVAIGPSPEASARWAKPQCAAMSPPILSLSTSTSQMTAHLALATVMERVEKEALPTACWELLAELVCNVYEHARPGDSGDTSWGVEILPDADSVTLRFFDEGVGISGDRLSTLFAEVGSSQRAFRGKGLLTLKRHTQSGAFKRARVASCGTTVEFSGRSSSVTLAEPLKNGVEVTAMFRRSRTQ